MTKEISISISELRQHVALIAGFTFSRLAHRHKKKLDTVSRFTVYELKQTLSKFESSPNFGKNRTDSEIRALILSEFHDLLPAFEKTAAEILPPHRPYDHQISLKEEFEPPFGPLYSLSKQKLETL
jgi:hypothetical protein